MKDETQQALVQIATETLKSFDGMKPHEICKEDFILYASCIAILSNIDAKHTEPMESITETHSTPHDASEYINYMREELTDAQKYIAAGLPEIAEEELAHAMYMYDKAMPLVKTNKDMQMLNDLRMRHDNLKKQIANR